jgi:hypothetical protein
MCIILLSSSSLVVRNLWIQHLISPESTSAFQQVRLRILIISVSGNITTVQYSVH